MPGKKKKRQAKIVCPQCKGEGYYFVKTFMGIDCNDEPRYYDALRPCNTCMETIRRKKPGFK